MAQPDNAVVDKATGIVLNIIVGGGAENCSGCLIVPINQSTGPAGIGQAWNGSAFSQPAPVISAPSAPSNLNVIINELKARGASVTPAFQILSTSPPP